MPILEVTIVGELETAGRTGLAGRLADAAARALESRPRGTWVTVHFVLSADYAENDGGPEPGVLPVFVRVLVRELAVGDALRAQAEALTAAIAAECGRPAQNVHVLYEPAARSRVAFGGRLVE
jgi:phenylpyruvate tautomerase PptA (4-oxalocrotonate tautomerase family)